MGRNFNLPETACISVRGPNPIPPIFTGSDRPAFHWGDDILVDERKGEIETDSGFDRSTKLITDEVLNVLVNKCGYPSRNVFFLGFGQGGMAALHIASSSDLEFGGVMSIGGKLPSSSKASGKSKTPVMVLGGSKSTQITRSAIDGLKERFGNVEYVRWDKPDDSMPKKREEMLPIMKFFARRLKSRAGVPEGALEI